MADESSDIEALIAEEKQDDWDESASASQASDIHLEDNPDLSFSQGVHLFGYPKVL